MIRKTFLYNIEVVIVIRFGKRALPRSNAQEPDLFVKLHVLLFCLLCFSHFTAAIINKWFHNHQILVHPE